MIAKVTPRLELSLVGNVKQGTASLATNGVGVVTLQAAVGHGKRTLWGRTSVCKSRKNRVTPKIMITIEVSRPNDPCNVMSPKPVVVNVVTVK